MDLDAVLLRSSHRTLPAVIDSESKHARMGGVGNSMIKHCPSS